jgi:hypothetical protein
MTEETVTRAEYEQFTRLYEVRHSELRLEIKELETGLKTDMSSMNVKLDTLSGQMARQGANAWKLVAVSLINFMVGGGVIGLLSYLHIFGR